MWMAVLFSGFYENARVTDIIARHNPFKPFCYHLLLAVFAGTLLKCHWTYRLYSARVKVAHLLCCCTPKKLIWWKNWSLKEHKRNRFGTDLDHFSKINR